MTFSCRFRRTEWILGLILLIACIEMVVYTVFGTARPQAPREQPAMTMEQARHYIRDTGNLLIIDVRSRKEFFRGHLDHALNIPIHSFPHLVKTIPKDFPVLLYCFEGYRSLQAYKLLRRLRPDIKSIRYMAGQFVIAPER